VLNVVASFTDEAPEQAYCRFVENNSVNWEDKLTAFTGPQKHVSENIWGL